MAIFHCAVSHGSRKTGQSGAAKVDYIMRCGKYDRDPGEVIGAWAGHLPSWADGNPRVFFAAADEYERSNGRLFTQVLFAIPNELSDQEALLLAYHYAEAVTENGAPYALAVHRGGVEVPDSKSAAAAPEEADEEELPPHNRHGHLVICERIDDGIERTAKEWFRRANKKEPALGGAAKDREMNGGNWVPEIRHLCADYVNFGLERAGFSERVTCESHETRITRAETIGDDEEAERLRLHPPGIHLGPTAWAIEKGRKGRPARPSWRGDLNRAIAAEGEELRGKVEELNAKLSQLDVQEEAVTETLEAARRIAAAQFEQREEALLGTSLGGEILRAVRVEMVGDSAAPASVVQQGEMLEVTEERFGAALDLREAGFQETSVGSRYLADATQSILGGEQSPTLPQRELIITTAESRLEQDLDRREATLRASVAGVEVLDTMQLERADQYGSVLTLVQHEQLVETAERRLERREAEEEVRRELDRREEVLRSIGTQHLFAAARELFGEGKQARTLADRKWMIGEAERRVEEEQRGREEELGSVSLGAQYLSEAEQEGLGEGKRAVLAARDAIVTKAEQRLEADLSRRESDLVATSFGPALLREAFGERGDGDARLSFATRDRVLEQVERRAGKTLTVQEEALRSIPFGRQCLSEVEGRSEDVESVAVPLGERESRVRRAKQLVREELDRLEKEHVARAGHEDLLVEATGALGGDSRTLSLRERWDVYERAQSRFEEEQRELSRDEAAVEKDPAGEEFLRNARLEVLGAADREATLAERARIVKAAAALQKAAAAKREAEVAAGRDLDRREEALRSLSIGAKLLAVAEQEVLGKGKRAEALSARAAVVGDAERRADEALKGREEALRSRSLGERDGEPVAAEIDGAWLYESKLAALEAGQRQRGGLPDRGRREQALVWAEQQMERLDALHEGEALHPFFERLSELGPAPRPGDIDRSLDHAEEERRAAAARRRARVDALSGDERVFFEEKLDALDPQRREPGTPKATHVDAAVDYARARVVALDEEIEGRRAVIEQTPGDGYARLLAAGFGAASRQEKVEALAVMEADLAETFTRREERVRSDGAGEEFLERGRREVLGAAGRQAETLPERGEVIVAAETYLRQAVQRRRAEAERREAQHQSISDTPGGDARLGAAGWDEARTDSERDQVLAIVERDLTADFERREEALRSDETGEALLRRGRFAVLGADREAATLAERGRIIEQAEALRQKAEAERRRQAELEWEEKRDASVRALDRLPGGRDLYHAYVADLDPAWDPARNNKTTREKIDAALDAAASDSQRLGHLRDVLANPADAACYRAVLEKCGDRFTVADVDAAIEAVLRRRADLAERREARYQLVSDTTGGDERLRAAGWEEARTDSEQDRVLTTVERDITADFDRREKALRTDNQGDEFLRRARLAVLVTDREVATLAERGGVIERAEMDREAARRQQLREAVRRRREEEEAARRREEEAARQQEEERQRRELAGREVAIRATSSGSQRLDAERRAKFGTTKRSLSVDEETSIVEVVELQVAEDLAQRETEVAARVGGTALLRAVPKRRGQASSGSLAEREETVMAVEQRLRAADAVEALLPATAPDPTRLDYRVPAVSNAVLDQAVTADDPLFVQDVVFLLRERYAHRAQDAENGYAAAARTASQQRYLGSALASALQWCVLKIREIILAACHKILGGRGEAGERVQALLASDGAVRQTYQRAAESAAEEVAIDVNAFYKAAASGRDQVAVLEQETARRQQVLAIAAGGMDRQAAHAAAEEESDDRLARLVGVYADAEQRSCYRAALGAEQVTLERVDAALDATATIVRRKEAIFDYPGNDQHPSGKALYTAGLRSLAPPDWRPGEDLPAGFPNQVLEDVESQLADRVQRASDAVEASVPTTQPYPNIKPDYRVPAVDDELLDLLVQEDDNAFFEATVVELRERYAQRARYDTPREERYTAADRSSSQQKYLGPSDAQARAQEKHRLHLREIISVACDATLGGDLGERLAQRRDLAQQVAAATEKKLPMVRPELHRPEYQVPAVFDQTLEHVAAASTNPVIQAAAAEVRVRYERRAGFDVPYKERYGPDDRRRAEWSHLRARVEIKHARAERLWLESRGSSPRPTREATEASVLNDHRSSILEAFEIAYDEVVGRGELGARLRKHREQIEFAADSVERDLQTMKSPERLPCSLHIGRGVGRAPCHRRSGPARDHRRRVGPHGFA